MDLTSFDFRPNAPSAITGEPPMIREIKHAFPLCVCRRCGKAPLMLMDKRKGGTFFVECTPCGIRTRAAAEQEEAAENWGLYREPSHVRALKVAAQ